MNRTTSLPGGAKRSPVVATESGSVVGIEQEERFAFLGIPYAAPPIGARRFAPPERPDAWLGVRDACAYGPTAPRPHQDFALIPEPVIPGDDYLNLNVFTPSLGDAQLPVLVWIHGGGFFAGCSASPWFAGTHFARDGVVTVSFNYRLGVDGFALLEDAVDNRGVLDWIAALEWVQENIRAFGGDPANVTIAGQSAGGAACAILLGTPRAQGLFRRAIMMSGSSGFSCTRERNEEFSQNLAARLGVTRTQEGFASVPFERLFEVQFDQGATVGTPNPLAVVALLGMGGLLLQPVPDDALIPTGLREALRGGAGDDADVLIGATESEFEFEFARFASDVDDALLVDGARMLELDASDLERYREANPSMPPATFLGHLVTDRTLRIPALRVAESRASRGRPTYLYDFRWRSRSTELSDLGASHCLDIPFVFDALDAEGVETVAGSHPPQELADIMHRAWVSFVSDGDPGWPAYDLDRRATMIFDGVSRVESDPLQLERTIWPDSV